MGFRTVCIENRSKCSYMGGYLIVTQDTSTTKIHLSEISSLILSTTQVYISGYLLSELAKSKIPLIACNEKQMPESLALPLYGAHNCSQRVEEELQWTLPSKKRVWKTIVEHKIARQADVLRLREHDYEAAVLDTYAREVRSGDVTNREAAAAGLYFAALFGRDFNRDQDNYINASLNYGYAILLSKVARELVSRGYITQAGIFHHSSFNQWNLACDFMEPFRPYVDAVVLFSGEEDFTKRMRILLMDMLNCELSYNAGRYKVHSVVSLYVKDCLDALSKRISPDNIKSYEFTQ